MVPGRIFRHERFYLDREAGLLKPKYFVVLAIEASGDCVARLLTSRAHARPEDPPCFHGMPYPGYFLGVPGQGLGSRTWVDLRFLEDFDGLDFRQLMARGVMAEVQDLDRQTFIELLDCAARADDTTRHQERAIRAELAGGTRELNREVRADFHRAALYSSIPVSILGADTDSLYIDLSSRPSAASREISEGVVLDYDADGCLVGIDIDNASARIELDKLVLSSLPGKVETAARS